MSALIPRGRGPAWWLALAAFATAGAPVQARIIPDSTVLARVGPRTVTAGVFMDNWVAGNPMTRPAVGDSAGRREFLDVLVNRELLRLAALERPTTLDFGQRAKLAGMRNDLLRNALYVKLIRDSVVITDDDLKLMRDIKGHLLRLRRITCRTQEECAGIRARLVRGEPWSELVKLSIDTSTVRKDGDTGMLGYLHLGPSLSQELFKLQEGAISPVLYSQGFWHIFYVQQRFPIASPPVEKQYRSLREEVRRVKEAQLLSLHEERYARERQVKYNAENVAFAVLELARKGHVTFTAHGPEIDLSAVPEFAPADTHRVLATGLDGDYTLGAFLRDYLDRSPLARPTVQNPEDMIHAINSFMSQPYLLKVAEESGMERSDYFKQELQNQTERMLIERLYADSVERRVRITPQERRRYYEKNKNLYFTYTREHLFAFYRPDSAWAKGLADSLRRKLLDPAAVARQDSLLHPGGAWSEERVTWSNEPNDLRGTFNEMKDGEVRLMPGEGVSVVVMRVEQIPGHQLSLAEVEASIDENLRNERAETLLKALLERLRKRYRVTLYPETLMDLDLTLI